MRRRTVLGGTVGAATVGSCGVQSATALAKDAAIRTPPEPLVWPVVTRLPPGIRSFSGHTDTVPDVVGRIGVPPSLVIFTEGNHLMVLLSDDVVGGFPSWAKSQPQHADLDLDNIVVVTLPQPVVVQMIRTGGIALGNLALEVSRKFGFYPDIVMGGPAPLRQLRQLEVIEPRARFFSKNRGLALLVRERQSTRDSWPRWQRCIVPFSGAERYVFLRIAFAARRRPVIFPRWSPAVMRTWPLHSFTLFLLDPDIPTPLRCDTHRRTDCVT